MEAIMAAKAHAHGAPTAQQIPSMETKITIGHGQGRATREFEIIWWPCFQATDMERSSSDITLLN